MAGHKKTAEDHGFNGEYIADELNYRSFYSLEVLQPEPNDYHPSEPEVAAKYIGRMIAINLGMDISVGTPGINPNERPIEWRMIRNMAYLLEGLLTTEFPVEVNAGDALVRQYMFEDQDGNRYLAIWNDGEAKVTSDNLEYSLTLGNYAAESVIVMDPFFSVMQTINFNNDTDGVHIENLILKDYPLIYKINALP